MEQFEVGEIIDGRFRIVRLLGRGGFGCVYVADDLHTGSSCALKVESTNVQKPVLKMEVVVLQKLNQSTEHACQFIGCGRIPGRAAYVAMTLLGQNLYDLQRSRADRRFEGSTVSRLAYQCLEAIEALHNIGYIHRDIKPANFVMGLTAPTHRIVHLIDFGLARRHLIENTTIKPRATAGFRGTVRYASVAAHNGHDLGRRDDLCSLLYVLVEFRMGSLPWRDEVDDRNVGRIKWRYGPATLMGGMERQYAEIAAMVFRLKFSDRPEYAEFYRLLEQLQTENRYQAAGAFEWE